MTAYKGFDSLFAKCYRYCMPVLKKYATTEQDAEDVFNEAMTIFWIRWKRGDIKNQKNIPAFICTTAKRLLLKLKKTQSKTVEDTVLEDEEAADDLLSRAFEKPSSQKAIFLKKAFSKLGQACQKLITAKYVYKHNYEGIAEDFGLKNGQVAKTQTHRCIKRIKTYFKEEQSK